MAQPYTILVLSDSHGNVDNMRRAVEQFQPHHILHLGDCRRDAGQHRRSGDQPACFLFRSSNDLLSYIHTTGGW